MKNLHVASYGDKVKPLTEALPKYDRSVVIRLGGSLAYEDYEVHINSKKAVVDSINKETQKNLLLKNKCKTLPLLEYPVYPCVLKGKVRSCGTHVSVCYNAKDFAKAQLAMKDCKGYLIEPLFKATSEYRLHCTQNEVFFAVKKIKRNPEDIIINHKNHYNVRDFVKPRLWADIQKECLKAMKTLGLDIACFDVMYSSVDPNNHDFYIAEANTNPELLENTFQAYVKALDKIIREKIGAIPNLFEEIAALKPSAKDLLDAIKKLPENTLKQIINNLK